MTAYIKKAIGISERTQECADWARHPRLREVAREAFRVYSCTDVEREMHIQCCLVFVAAKKPPTFEDAARMVREIAFVKMNFGPRMTDAEAQWEEERKKPKKKAPKRIDESTEQAGDVRGAIAEHAAAELEWRGQRGAPMFTHAQLERMARDAFIRAEKMRTR